MTATDKNRLHARPVIPRALDLCALVEKKSHFLFGPRQTGKTFLIHMCA